MNAQTTARTAELQPITEAWAEHRDAILRQTPSARKSFGSYKPVIVRGDGSTEICGQNAKLSYKVWQGNRPDPKSAYVKHARGVTFDTREEAIQYARDCITQSAARMDTKIAEYNARAALAKAGAL